MIHTWQGRLFTVTSWFRGLKNYPSAKAEPAEVPQGRIESLIQVAPVCYT